MMCRHVLGNSIGLFVVFGILFGMVLHLWLWRRRCAPRKTAEMKTMPGGTLPFGGRFVPRRYIQYDPSAPYAPFGPLIVQVEMGMGLSPQDILRLTPQQLAEIRRIHKKRITPIFFHESVPVFRPIGGLPMKMPAKGDPVMTIPEVAFYRLMLSPAWLTPDRYPVSVELIEGEIGCVLSHGGAVRVRVQKEAGRSFNDRVAKLVLQFIYPEHYHGKVLPHGMSEMSLEEFRIQYEVLVRKWRDKGCPDYY